MSYFETEFLKLEEEILLLKQFKRVGIAVYMLFVLSWSHLSRVPLVAYVVASPPLTSLEHFPPHTLLTHWKTLQKHNKRRELPPAPKTLTLHTLTIILYSVQTL